MTAAAVWQTRGRGFTLAEMLAVVAIVGVLAASVTPAIRMLDDARRAALRAEVVRMVTVARAHSAASARPSGVEIDLAGGAARLLQIPAAGEAPVALHDALGAPRLPVPIQRGEAAVTGAVMGDGREGGGVLWFGLRGVPELRDPESWVRTGGWTTDAVIELAGVEPVVVSRGTGAVR